MLPLQSEVWCWRYSKNRNRKFAEEWHCTNFHSPAFHYLISGELRENGNQSANMRKMCFYVCPVCGNIITSVGHGTFSCCGITLPEVEAEKDEEGHCICVETVDNEHSVTIQHPMGKGHYISFIAYVTTDALDLVKLYPEQGISVRFRKKGHGIIYAYCNRHGMFKTMV